MVNQTSKTYIRKKNIRKTKLKKTHRNNYRYKRKLITRNKLVKQKSSRGTRKIQNVLSGGEYRKHLYNFGYQVAKGVRYSLLFGIISIFALLWMASLIISITIYICYVCFITYIAWIYIIGDPLGADALFTTPWNTIMKLHGLKSWQSEYGGGQYRGGGGSLLQTLNNLQTNLGRRLCIPLLTTVLVNLVDNPEDVAPALFDTINTPGDETLSQKFFLVFKQNSKKVTSETTTSHLEAAGETLKQMSYLNSNNFKDPSYRPILRQLLTKLLYNNKETTLKLTSSVKTEQPMQTKNKVNFILSDLKTYIQGISIPKINRTPKFVKETDKLADKLADKLSEIVHHPASLSATGDEELVHQDATLSATGDEVVYPTANLSTTGYEATGDDGANRSPLAIFPQRLDVEFEPDT